ncbi:penicillin-binding transpeptidase domain-containing protein [Caldisalinibacter kiritimatiensis]|uniref:Penicillin-binding protein 2 (PBP-2) n=1 Tax=Caldisalinibacter kiritimatiensis TaxID=1304284 RepID=R1CBZ1_9FIRM|nr:penicillin-binding transpeptidase domain-containing protein [Caldisalinibacter kiritimatiensis]EOC99824.1 Penicillin-binding protein 2 (PBP-2) [Caldisalinibacter kiritimatiensis]
MIIISLINKLKDRYTILLLASVVLFLVIFFRLATLTIVQGDEYRKKSDMRRLKNIEITAPRGNIYDRYGRLLAGTRPSFTVQIMKDEIDKEQFNDIALRLVKLLEEEGERYEDDFPIVLNEIKFKDESYYYKYSEEPIDKFVEIFIDNNLMSELLEAYYKRESYKEEFHYLVGRKAVNVLENEGIEVPISIKLSNENKVVYSYKNDIDINKWKKENNFNLRIGPKDALMRLINNDEKIVKKILGHGIVRKKAYELLENKGLNTIFKLEPYSFTFDNNYKEIKRSLISNPDINAFNEITIETSAKEDFISIVLNLDIVVDNLFSNEFIINKENGIEKKIVPGKMLLNKFNKNNIFLPIICEVKDGKVIYEYKDETSKLAFLSDFGLQNELEAKEALIEIGKAKGFISEIITHDDVKGFAQKLMLKELNPRISIAKWEYMPLIDKKSWLNKSTHKIPEGSSAHETFNILRKKYNIDKSLSCYEARYIFLLKDRLDKQGYRAYQPVNIASGIKDETVAKISEHNLDLLGVKVAVEPMRYYPMEKTAAHILGYLGKISQRYEIDKYIGELGYSPNDLIGKTGIEEKFEEYLNGVDGLKKVEVDALGNTIRGIDAEKAIPGDELYLTIDAELQQVAEKALKHALEEIQKGGVFKSKWGDYNYREAFKNATSGSVVAIDVKTGEVLALANYPAYDPNLFSTGISTEDWDELSIDSKDPLAPRPLYNIALQTAIQPGSTFKMITALAALEKGLDPEDKLLTKGYIDIGNKRFGCWIWNSSRGTHGSENLYDAIRDSCNYYFYTLTLNKDDRRTGKNLDVKVDLQDIINVANEFGLNDETGIEIDIPSETYGGVPNPQDKINTTKVYLRRFLTANIDNYIVDISKDIDKNAIINEIVSWVELNQIPSRIEVINKLNNLGLDALKKNEKGIPLADIIKYSYLNQASWKDADNLNVAIGQGANRYTPIQMANYIATLANSGVRNKVSVVKKIQKYDGRESTYNIERSQEKVSIKRENIDIVKKGMLEVTKPGGTAYSHFRNFPVDVGAKTGTAQKDGINPVTGEEYDNYAWFVAFAPYDDPQIAVATVIFQGGHGGYAAPVAKEIIAQYLGLNNNSKEITFKNKMVR